MNAKFQKIKLYANQMALFIDQSPAGADPVFSPQY